MRDPSGAARRANLDRPAPSRKDHNPLSYSFHSSIIVRVGSGVSTLRWWLTIRRELMYDACVTFGVPTSSWSAPSGELRVDER